jgi:hypothetical protein
VDAGQAVTFQRLYAGQSTSGTAHAARTSTSAGSAAKKHTTSSCTIDSHSGNKVLTPPQT